MLFSWSCGGQECPDGVSESPDGPTGSYRRLVVKCTPSRNQKQDFSLQTYVATANLQPHCNNDNVCLYLLLSLFGAIPLLEGWIYALNVLFNPLVHSTVFNLFKVGFLRFDLCSECTL